MLLGPLCGFLGNPGVMKGEPPFWLSLLVGLVCISEAVLPLLPRPDGCRQSTVELLKQDSRWVFENPCEYDAPRTSLSDHREGWPLCIPRLKLAVPGLAGRKSLCSRAPGTILWAVNASDSQGPVANPQWREAPELDFIGSLRLHFPTPVCPDAWGGGPSLNP